MSDAQPKQHRRILYVVVGLLSAVVVAQSAYIVYIQSGLKSALNSPIIASLNNLQKQGDFDSLKGFQAAPPPDANQGSAKTPAPFGLNLDDPDKLTRELARLIQQFGQAYGDTFKMLQDSPLADTLPQPNVIHPAFHMVEDQHGYTINVDMNVKSMKDIHVSLNGQMLSVSAPVPNSDGQYERRIVLSDPVDPRSLDTQYIGGVLTITIKKENTGGKIPVHLPI